MKSRSPLDFLKRTYAAADPRSLGVFRIALGVVLFFDVLRRVPEIGSHYSNTGWLTNHFMLFRPMSEHQLSLYLAFSTPNEVAFLMGLHLVLCVLFIAGWRTRLMHALLALLLVSINSRNIMLENGGWIALTALTIWTLFLPLGARFSVDAVRTSLRARREKDAEGLNDRGDPAPAVAPVVSLAVFALLAQWIVIYAFNAIQKSGPEWRDGTAVYYLLEQERVLTGFGAWLRGLLPLGALKAATYAALGIEVAIPLFLASPFRPGLARMIAWGLAVALHLPLALAVALGPFSWAMMIAFIVFVPSSVWERWGPRLAARFPRHELGFDAASGFWVGFCRVVKRLDVLGRIRFAPLAAAVPGAVQPVASLAATSGETDGDGDGTADDEEDEEEEEEEEEEDEDDEQDDAENDDADENEDDDGEDERENSAFIVTSEGGKRFTGVEAVFALARSVPGGAALTLPLRLPGVHGWVQRRLRRASRDPARYDEYFELESFETLPERPPEPAPARLALGRAARTARESLVAIVMVCAAAQVLAENPAVPSALKPRQPLWMRAVIVYPRLFQGWTMFAPSPPREDSRLVVDGVTQDGRRLDPLTGQAPKFEVAPPEARRMNQLWGEFHRRVGLARFEPYLEGVKDYIRRHHDVVGRPQDKLVAFEAWVVSQPIQAPGLPRKAPERRRLFAEGTMSGAPSDAHRTPH